MASTLIKRSPLHIPEILQTIARLLDNPSLVACLQVARHWHHCCAPILWAAIHPKDWALPGFRPRRLVLFGPLIRSLGWHHRKSSLSTQLKGLKGGTLVKSASSVLNKSTGNSNSRAKGGYPVWYHHDGDSSDVHQDDHPGVDHDEENIDRKGLRPLTMNPACLPTIVARCSNLQTLRLNGESNPGLHIKILDAVWSLKCLETLELVVSSMVLDPPKDSSVIPKAARLNVWEMVCGCGQLQRLILRGKAFSLEPPPAEEAPPSEPDSTFMAGSGPWSDRLLPSAPPRLLLQHLSLDTPSALSSEVHLSAFLRQCPSLKSLAFPGGLGFEWCLPQHPRPKDHDREPPMDILDRTGLIDTLAWFCPEIDSFTINTSGSTPISEERLTTLVRGLCSPLKTFGARACVVGDSTLRALAECSPGLEVLDISLAKTAPTFTNPALGMQQEALVVESTQQQQQQHAVNEYQGLSRSGLLEYFSQAKALKRITAEGVWIHLEALEHMVAEEAPAGTASTAPYSSEDLITPAPLLPSPRAIRGWACKDTLQHLVIGFTSANRSVQPNNSINAMFALLSQLTRLRHLAFSHSCLNLTIPCFDSHTNNISNLSETSTQAAAGFQQLSTLKCLRVFGIETCGYSALTRDHFRFMVQEWPELEVVYMNAPGTLQERIYRGWLDELLVREEGEVTKSREGRQVAIESRVITHF